ncbi:MAG: hypothetical protein KBS56_05395 [Clostridiales bacterium]|nr:hypothetical protein [Candidatus Crickella equi]
MDSTLDAGDDDASGQPLTKRLGISWKPKEPHGSFLPSGEWETIMVY